MSALGIIGGWSLTTIISVLMDDFDTVIVEEDKVMHVLCDCALLANRIRFWSNET